MLAQAASLTSARLPRSRSAGVTVESGLSLIPGKIKQSAGRGRNGSDRGTVVLPYADRARETGGVAARPRPWRLLRRHPDAPARRAFLYGDLGALRRRRSAAIGGGARGGTASVWPPVRPFLLHPLGGVTKSREDVAG